MKLWQKLSMVMVIVLLLVMGLAGSLVISRMTAYNKKKTVENYEQQLKSTAYAFKRELENSPVEQYTQTTKNAYLNYTVKRFGASIYILLEEGRVVCNMTPYELQMPYEKLFDNQDDFCMIQKSDIDVILICGRKLSDTSKGDYALLLVQEITPMYEEIRQIALYYVAVYIGAVITAVVLVFVITKHLLHPLRELQEAAGELGNGNLQKRVIVTTRDEIGTLAGEFNRMAAQIEEQVDRLSEESMRRRQMLASLTHELKTPMTSIIGYADSLLHVKLSEEHRERALNHIYEEGNRLGRLSSKLLSLIGMYENDSISLEMTDVSHVISRVKEVEAYHFKEKDMILTCHCDMAPRMLDKDLIESLLVNLIDNAVKASKQGDEIIVTALGNQICVTDCGYGIPKSELARVTEAFYMVDKARSRKAGGCGLGLALCSQIAALHGARLTINSIEGLGTQVSVIFEEE